MTKIIIDPRSNYAYGSYYLYGLERIYRRHTITYSTSPFKHLAPADFRFIVVDGNTQIRYYVHTRDTYEISEDDYQWCDVYGCVNTNYGHYPCEEYPKLISLCPSFGIRIRGKWETMLDSFFLFCLFPLTIIRRQEWNKNTQKTESNPYKNIKHHFGRYYRAWKDRLPLSVYTNNTPSKDNYVFFLSTLWYSDEWNKNDEGVNLRRARFIRACKSIEGLQFEGGLLGSEMSSNDLFADVIIMQRVPFSDWIEKTKRSALVFNTPAFWNCHGWKLGEYLALGKCIISTPLSNDLPYPLEHGMNIHFVEDNEQSIREAIEYILAHPEYRHKLERGARAYWEKYGSPEASLKLLGIQ